MKKILIIGASSGIGREIALLYARSGHRVAITGRRVNLLRQIHDQYPDNIYFAWHDIRRADKALETYRLAAENAADWGLRQDIRMRVCYREMVSTIINRRLLCIFQK
jgi:NADP-dependent 3-hydroxy acid dehydrogenase YdfG